MKNQWKNNPSRFEESKSQSSLPPPRKTIANHFQDKDRYAPARSSRRDYTACWLHGKSIRRGFPLRERRERREKRRRRRRKKYHIAVLFNKRENLESSNSSGNKLFGFKADRLANQVASIRMAIHRFGFTFLRFEFATTKLACFFEATKSTANAGNGGEKPRPAQ